jgi:hypothetical protein
VETTTFPLFNRPPSLDPDSLIGALFLHCQSVEEVLMASGQVPGIGYAALDVVRVAATLMTAPSGDGDGYARWRLPEPECDEAGPATPEDGDVPF